MVDYHGKRALNFPDQHDIYGLLPVINYRLS